MATGAPMGLAPALGVCKHRDDLVTLSVILASMASGQIRDRTVASPSLYAPRCHRAKSPSQSLSPTIPQEDYLEVEGDFGQQQFCIDIHQVSILVTKVPLGE